MSIYEKLNIEEKESIGEIELLRRKAKEAEETSAKRQEVRQKSIF